MAPLTMALSLSITTNYGAPYWCPTTALTLLTMALSLTLLTRARLAGARPLLLERYLLHLLWLYLRWFFDLSTYYGFYLLERALLVPDHFSLNDR